MIEVIAEVGQTNEGSVEKAVAAVEAFAGAGATGIKFQWLNPDTLVVPSAPRYWQTNEATSQAEAFARAGMIGYSDWGPVIAACHERGVEFITTPFDLDAIHAWEAFQPEWDLRTLKIASGDITNLMLIESAARAVGRQGRLIISTGGAGWREIQRAVMLAAEVSGCGVVLLACTLEYPAREANLARIGTLRGLAEGWLHVTGVGYSDHTEAATSARYAVIAGATVLEKHVSLGGDPDDVGDHAMALGPDAFRLYVEEADAGESLLGDGILGCTDAERPAVDGARRGLYAAADIAGGDEFTADNVIALRPSPTRQGHVSAGHWDDVNGQRAPYVYLSGDPIVLPF